MVIREMRIRGLECFFPSETPLQKPFYEQGGT
jgi:hypothetical protein